MTRQAETPYTLGYRMPAEWEPHAAVWLAWPHDLTSFPYLDQAESAFADFVSAVHTSERVELLVRDVPMQRKATQSLQGRGVDCRQVRFHRTDYADIWFRDYGPIFVVDRRNELLAITKWLFNSWGNKYKELLKDSRIPYFMNDLLRLPIFEPGIVLEGGSIDVNGRGTLLTTEQCLLNKNRNPRLCKKEIEIYLRDYLGATHCIWLAAGIEGDDTDGHVDDVARFVNPTTVVCVRQPDRGDPDHASLESNYQLLRKATDQDGHPLHVIPLPVPGRVEDERPRLPASYANFYISNDKVLVPTFGVDTDARAVEILQSVFLDRQVEGVNAFGLLHGLGAFHCMSQQQPAALSRGGHAAARKA